MVQWGIFLMLVVMKKIRKKIVPPILGGLWWRVPGGTSADRYRVPRSSLLNVDDDTTYSIRP